MNDSSFSELLVDTSEIVCRSVNERRKKKTQTTFIPEIVKAALSVRVFAQVEQKCSIVLYKICVSADEQSTIVG